MTSIEHTSPSAPPTGQGKIRLGVICFVIGLIVLFVLGYLPRQHNRAQLAAMAQEARSAVPEVTVVTPHFAAGADLMLPGNIQAIEVTTINARTSGYLNRRYVDIGSRVKAGQVMAEIESPDVDQQVYQAVAQTAQSRALVGQSQADVARQQAGVVQTRASVIQQRANIKQAQAQLASSQSKIAQAQAAEGQAEAELARARQAQAMQEASLKQAQAQKDLADVTNKRYQDLLKQGFVAQQDADQAEATLKTTTASVNSAQASLNASQEDVHAAQQAVHASQAAVQSAQADVEAGKENVAAAQASLSAISATVHAAQASVNVSQATVQANRAQVQSNQANAQHFAVLRSFEKIVAPFDGVITARNVDTGALINAGNTTTPDSPTATTPQTGLFGIARTDVLRIQVYVPQTFVNAIRPGQTAKVLVRELPGRTFEGTIFQSAGALDSTSRTLLTEVHIPNKGNVLRPGMYAQVQFPTASARSLPRIASNTLVIDAAGTRVASVTPDNKVHFLLVQIGRDFGTEVEITEGLHGDERLITNPTDDLKEGSSVQVLSASQ
jgi:RND family efflux transporter MFP subunit